MPTSAAASAGASLAPSVAGDRDELTAALQQSNDAVFRGRRRPRDHAAVPQPRVQFGIVEPVGVSAAQNGAGGQPGQGGDGGRGGGMVAGDHDRGHPGAGQGGDRLGHAVSHGVDECGQPDVSQVLFGGVPSVGDLVEVSLREGDDPSALPGQGGEGGVELHRGGSGRGWLRVLPRPRAARRPRPPGRERPTIVSTSAVVTGDLALTHSPLAAGRW
jgi:hypothetical protein